MLQKTTELHGQKLIIPQKLELTAGDRLVMQENSHIFEQNGFAFSVALDKGNETYIYRSCGQKSLL